ncbi:hypothetical protein ACFPYJ_02690 [Paenibacillus solisilvae]|uniref:Uncharacterized protein n=1 Tax=Paenibacillus solisilvae TaxID=2486751 RepID=A0ABW0VRD8_9BACL
MKKVTLFLWVICVLIKVRVEERDENGETETSSFYRRAEEEVGGELQRTACDRIGHHVHAAFKLAALQAYNEGQTPSEIFIRAGFDLDVIGHKKSKHSL